MTAIKNDVSNMNTIPRLAAKYRERGVSERAIRRWVEEEAFPVVRVGIKVLINESNFEKFLQGGYSSENN